MNENPDFEQPMNDFSMPAEDMKIEPKRGPGRPAKPKVRRGPRFGKPNPLVAAAEKVAVAEPEESDPEADGLADAFRKVIAARNSAKDLKTAKRSIEDMAEAMAGLSDEDFRVLMGNAEFQDIMNRTAHVAELSPGSKIYDINGREMGYVPFSLGDFKNIYPMHTWTPSRDNMCISVNGVSIAVWEGVEVTTPKCFYDIEMEALQLQRQSNPDTIIRTSTKNYSDGVMPVERGWRKRTDEELIRTEGVER